jgi:exonuclease VII small subunit
MARPSSSTIAASLERVRALRESLKPTTELMDTLKTHVATLKQRGLELEQALPFDAEEHSAPATPSLERTKALGKTLELVSELARALETQVGALDRQSRGLEEALPSLGKAPEQQLGPTDTSPPPQGAGHSKDAGGMADPARLAAVAMAMQGHSRQDVEAYLRSLAVPNIDQILASVFSEAEGT